MLEHLKQLEQLSPEELYEQGYYNKPIIIVFDDKIETIQFGGLREIRHLINLIEGNEPEWEEQI